MGSILHFCRRSARFLTTVVVLSIFFAFTYRDDLLGRVLCPLEVLTAQATVSLLHLLGIEAVRVASQIHHPGGFAYEIYYRCTGILPIAILTICILAYPAVWRCKVIGLIVGIFILLALNLVRLIHLFYIGVHFPFTFDFIHDVLWQGIIILATPGLWWGWSIWASRSASPYQPHREADTVDY